jgi:cyclic-di-AMP phosphodiesterase PgpH
LSYHNSRLLNDNELKFAKEQSFFEKSVFIRYLIGCIFTLCLFAFLHFREVRVEVLELNRTAPNYIVAQIDFDYFDEKATIILKQEAIRDLGKIYQISEKEIRNQRIEYENYLVSNPSWRSENEDSTFEKMYKGGEAVEKILLQLRFTDPRTFQRLEEVKCPTANFLIYTPSNLLAPEFIPQPIWSFVREKAIKEKGVSEKGVDLAIQFFEQKGWMIESDAASEKMLRKKIQAGITDKYTHVKAGSRLIDQGEKISSHHLVMLQAMKVALGKQRNLWHPLTLLGTLFMTLLVVGVCVAYFRSTQPLLLKSNRKLFLITTIFILTLGLAKATELFLLYSKTNWIEIVRYPIFVPFAAILLCSLINPATAAFVSGVLSIVLTMTLAFDRQEFLVLNMVAALVAILSARNLKKRKEVFVICFKAWLASVVVLFSFQLSQDKIWEVGIFSDIFSSIIFMLFTAILVVGLLPLLESTFRIMTDATLLEYMDPNNELLRRLSIEAPGTYQHSVIVGNLAESAALAIGANGLFCRVSCLYHDIGKMATPQYFTENQHGSMNIHQLLTPQESTQVIIAHVSEGVAMARKAGLPEQFIDIIKEHHGTTLVYYFYHKLLEKLEDKNLINENEFRYSGPKPRSKESTIIMIADSLEAASRSLEKFDERTVEELANRLIRYKAEDGQFDHSLLTLEELAIVKDTLIKTIVAYGHSRIKYPTKESDV